MSSNTRHSVPLSSSASFFNNSLSTCFSLLLSVLFSFDLLLLLIGGSAGFTFPILCADGALLTEFDEPGLDPLLLILEGLLFWELPDFSLLSLDDDTLFFVVAAVEECVFVVVFVEGFARVDFRDWSLFSVFNVVAVAPSVFFVVDRSVSFALPMVLINYNRCMHTIVPRASNQARSFACGLFHSFSRSLPLVELSSSTQRLTFNDTKNDSLWKKICKWHVISVLPLNITLRRFLLQSVSFKNNTFLVSQQTWNKRSGLLQPTITFLGVCTPDH